MALITFHVQDQPTAAPIEGALVHASSPWGPWNGITDTGGNFTADLGKAHYDLAVGKPGYVTLQMGADLEFPGTVAMALTPSIVPARLLNGIDAFMEYRFWLDANFAALDALRNERQALGFNAARVFMAGSKSQNGVLELSPFEPRYREQLRPFAQYYADHDEILLATMAVDYQIVCPKESDQLDVWQAMGQAFHGMPNVFLSLGNELSKNGVHNAAIFPKLGGVICSRGSEQTDMAPPLPELDFNEFHQRRDFPARENDTVASSTSLHLDGYQQPLIMSEGIPFAEGGDGSGQSSDPRLAWRLGRAYGTWWSGGVFHNRATQFGVTMNLNSNTATCARAWVEGLSTAAASVFRGPSLDTTPSRFY